MVRGGLMAKPPKTKRCRLRGSVSLPMSGRADSPAQGGVQGGLAGQPVVVPAQGGVQKVGLAPGQRRNVPRRGPRVGVARLGSRPARECGKVKPPV